MECIWTTLPLPHVPEFVREIEFKKELLTIFTVEFFSHKKEYCVLSKYRSLIHLSLRQSQSYVQKCKFGACLTHNLNLITMNRSLLTNVSILELLIACILINLYCFTKPTEYTYNIQNNIVFCHSHMFRHNCAIFKEFLHRVLKLATI